MRLKTEAFDYEFQSTLPVGGATLKRVYQYTFQEISIHAPRGGSDRPGRYQHPGQKNFNPRSPWGERPDHLRVFPIYRDFNPRSPWGERRSQMQHKRIRSYFNPRSPWGERPDNIDKREGSFM